MNIKPGFIFFAAFFLITIASSVLFAESISFRSAVPSSSGAFDKLRMTPRDSLDRETFCSDQSHLGMMYFDNGYNELPEGMYVCRRTEDGDFDWGMVILGSVATKP